MCEEEKKDIPRLQTEEEWYKKRRWDLLGAAGLIATTSFTMGVASAYYVKNKKGGDNADGKAMVGKKSKQSNNRVNNLR